jgi:hypothetical protein
MRKEKGEMEDTKWDSKRNKLKHPQLLDVLFMN